MKTAERILLVSMELFNHEGESQVSSVDIALELDISPGNLYYHYKGKEAIICAIFSMYKQRNNKIVKVALEGNKDISNLFSILYLLLECSYLFRFLFRNPADLLEKYPAISKDMLRLLSQQRETINQLLCAVSQQNQDDLNQHHQLTELVMLVFTQSANYNLLTGEDINDERYIYDSLAKILFVTAPYLRITKEEFEGLSSAIANREIG